MPFLLRYRLTKAAFVLLASVVMQITIRADSGGIVWSYFAGETSVAGYIDGAADAARFSFPAGIDVDAAGYLYVADSGNHAIRKISPNGAVTTLAGKAGESSVIDGNATSARFGNLSALKVSPEGTVYVVDTGRIRKVTPVGGVTTVAGRPYGQRLETLGESAPALSVEFTNPQGLALGTNGDVFLSNQSQIIRVSDGIASVFLTAQSPGLDRASIIIKSLVFGQDGHLYFDGRSPTTIYRVGMDGVAEPVASAPSSSPFGSDGIYDIALTTQGEVWAARGLFALISRIGNNEISTIAQFDPTKDSRARFTDARALAPAPDGGVYLTDIGTHSIQHLSREGVSTIIAGRGAKLGLDGPLDEAVFTDPSTLRFDGDDTIYVADRSRIRKISLSQAAIITVLDREQTAYPADRLDYVEVDSAGGLILSNFPRNCVSRLQTDGTLQIIAGAPGVSVAQDGPVSVARFRSPRELRQDKDGVIYVIDGESDSGAAIRRISPNGTVETISGIVGEPGIVDGAGSAARFFSPSAMAIAPNGSIWVADFSTLRRVTSQGTVTTFSDGTQRAETAPGPAAELRYSVVRGIAFDALGDAVVTDSGPVRVRRVHADGTVVTFQWNDNPYAPHDGPFLLHGIAYDNLGRIYTIDPEARRLLVGVPVSGQNQLANLSVRKRIGDANGSLAMGFVIAGSSGKQMLLRAVGPTLADYGVAEGFLQDPNLTIFDSDSALVDANLDWGGGSLLTEIFQRVGAFPLTSSSADAAIVRELPVGPFTMVVSTETAQSGEVLAEVYDSNLGGTARLSNLSTITLISPESGRLIAGFVISGTDPMNILVRGIGPALVDFGLSTEQVLQDPRIRLFREGTEIASNEDWSGSPQLTETFRSVGAFPLSAANSKDAALIVRLNPGAYTVHLESSDDTQGQALIEIYEIK